MTYATLAQVKAAAGIADAVDDTQIAAALAAAEEAIDGYCGRSFATAGTAATARVYSAGSADLIYVDDATSITLVETDTDLDGTWATTWATSDWQAEPLNGRVGAVEFSYSRIRAVGEYCFPVTARAAVRVTAAWGWAGVPDAVTQATIQTAIRYWKRFDTPLGFGGGPDTGLLYVSRQVDGDVAAMLMPYRHHTSITGAIA